MRIKLLLAAALCLGAMSLRAGLELYFDFEKREGARATDAGGNVAAFRGEPGPRYVADAPPGNAGRSKQSLELAKSLAFLRDAPELGDAWTVSCFVKPSPDGRGAQTLLCRPGGWFYQYNIQRGTVELFQSGNQENRIVFKAPIPAGEWKLWTLVKDGRQIRFYLDGKPAGSGVLSTDLAVSGGLYLGAAATNLGRDAKARIDDLAVWNHALDDEAVARLAGGAPPSEVGIPSRVRRLPTPPFTAANTKIHPLRRELSAREAVIVLNDNPADRELAEAVREALRKTWKIELPIREVAGHGDGAENLILCGGGMANALSRELAANLQISRHLRGAELRILPEALDWKRGVIVLAGRDRDEVAAAARELLKRFPSPDRLNFTIAPLHAPENPDPQAPVRAARKHFASPEARKVNLALNTYLFKAFTAYRATGDERHLDAFREILDLVCDFYPADLAAAVAAPTFEFHQFPQYCYLLENSDRFTAADRVRAAEFMRAVMEKAMDSWELVAPAKAYEQDKLEYFTNHYSFAARTVGNTARYLLSRYGYRPAEYFLAVGEHVFAGVRPCPLSPEDAGGYQYLNYRIFIDYMLSAGKFDKALFRSPEFAEYSEYAKGMFNHLGYTAGYGDAHATGMRGGFVPLREVDEIVGDEEVRQLLAMVGRRLYGQGNDFYFRQLQEWGIPGDLPLIADDRFNGLRLFTVNPVRRKILKLAPSTQPILDKATFRSSWEPEAEFLAVNGLNAAPHGHDDASGVSQYVAGPHLWLTEGDYIRRFAEHHNMVSVVRDGLAPLRLRNRIPGHERFARVAGTAQSEEKDRAILALLIPNLNGVDYHRYICWEHRGGFWVVDRLRAVKPGRYRFISRWRTTGRTVPQPQGVLVRQKPAADDGGLAAFSIGEGSGAAGFSHAEFERTHGRATGNLGGYPLSDRATRTRIYWKDAVLTEQEESVFVQYFRPLPGDRAEGCAVEQTAADTWRVREDDGVSAIRLDRDGIAFQTGRGFLALNDAPLPDLEADGRMIPNTPLPPPDGAETVELTARRRFPAGIAAVAAGRELFAVGLADGAVHLFDRDGRETGSCKLPGEISALGVIPTPEGERLAAGCRPPGGEKIAPGSVHFLDGAGRELWRRELHEYRQRPGAPAAIFPARTAGQNQPPTVAVGTESWHYYLFGLDGRERLKKEVTHAATAGAAGDFDGDGRDEIYGGTEYYYHRIFAADGKELTRHATTSPWNEAAAYGRLPAGAPGRFFAARSDGYLYAESLDPKRKWQVNLGGPAHGLVLLPDAVAAATVNGHITLVDGDGKVKSAIELPAPLTGLAAAGGLLYAPGLDGSVYAVNPATGRTAAIYRAAPPTGEERYRPQAVVCGDAVYATFGNELFKVK